MSTFNVNAKSKWDFIHGSFTCENLESYSHVLINTHLFNAFYVQNIVTVFFNIFSLKVLYKFL